MIPLDLNILWRTEVDKLKKNGIDLQNSVCFVSVLDVFETN